MYSGGGNAHRHQGSLVPCSLSGSCGLHVTNLLTKHSTTVDQLGLQLHDGFQAGPLIHQPTTISDKQILGPHTCTQVNSAGKHVYSCNTCIN